MARISIIQAADYLSVMEEIQTVFGGHIYFRDPRPPGKKRLAVIQINKQADVKRFLTAVLPHLRIKQEIAARALANIGEPRTKGTRSREVAVERTQCRKGHALTPDNLTPVKGAARGRCKTCARDAMRNRRATQSG